MQESSAHACLCVVGGDGGGIGQRRYNCRGAGCGDMFIYRWSGCSEVERGMKWLELGSCLKQSNWKKNGFCENNTAWL